ncbi:MAG TPA: sigma-70 family RNA polymerase sigma factor, partial [Vicinamibacteria bacterium]|nr:sigma-70 family RNA polymerase sigma factor [Vicinamibacteria bacterium]
MRFDTTSWSVILKATVGGSSDARQALATLCESYWPAVYALIRRKGHSATDAEDLTQGYFSRFLEKAYVKDFRPEAGRFRTFLCASVQHFLANEWDRERAQKRGGGRVPFSLDADAAEERYRAEPVDRVTPETLFERQWAAAMLARCLARLREAEGSAGRERFDKLKPFLGAYGSESRYAELARELGTSESGARVAVHRLRQRFGQVLRDEVARTV